MESAGAFITDGVQGFYSRRQLFGNAIDAAARQPASRAEQIGVGLPELTRNRWSPQVDSAISSRASWFMTTIHPSEI